MIPLLINQSITNEHPFMQKLSLIYHFANLMTNEPQVTYSNQNANYPSASRPQSATFLKRLMIIRGEFVFNLCRFILA
jgi:hypothetical protein